MRTSIAQPNCNVAKPVRVAGALFTLATALALNAPAALGAEPAGTASVPESRAQGVGMTREMQTATAPSQDPTRGPFERLSERDIKQYYLACAGEAIGRRIGSGEIKACSIAYDVLLTRHFGGDFMALLSWSRAHEGGHSHETSHSSD
jgi:hypothetical protein